MYLRALVMQTTLLNRDGVADLPPEMNTMKLEKEAFVEMREALEAY